MRESTILTVPVAKEEQIIKDMLRNGWQLDSVCQKIIDNFGSVTVVSLYFSRSIGRLP